MVVQFEGCFRSAVDRGYEIKSEIARTELFL